MCRRFQVSAEGPEWPVLIVNSNNRQSKGVQGKTNKTNETNKTVTTHIEDVKLCWIFYGRRHDQNIACRRRRR